MNDGTRIPPREALENGYWSAQPMLILCETQARKGVPVAAVNGECPAHGGDTCMVSYVPLGAARQQVTTLWLQTEAS